MRAPGLALGALAVVAVVSCAAPAPVPASGETALFGGLVLVRIPSGWRRQTRTIWGDSAVVLTDGERSRIRVHLRAGDPQKDDMVRALRSAPWDAASGGAAREVATVRVAGVDSALSRRVSEAMREEPGQDPAYFTDEHCVVPVGERFLLLVFETEDHRVPPSPAALDAREAGWRALLASLRISR